MKITDIKPYPVVGRHGHAFPWVFIEVETDEGVTGIGEALSFRSSGVLESLSVVRERLMGRDPTRIETIWEQLYRSGVSLPAISGVEMALWDILGKALNAPIHMFLGGKCRDFVDVYVDGFFREAVPAARNPSTKILTPPIRTLSSSKSSRDLKAVILSRISAGNIT